MPVQH